ncbi:unnamed protein product [Heterosigma akashiwo]
MGGNKWARGIFVALIVLLGSCNALIPESKMLSTPIRQCSRLGFQMTRHKKRHFESPPLKMTAETHEMIQSMLIISESLRDLGYQPAEGFEIVPVTEPVEVTGEIWAGLAAGVFPFAWAAYEFWKRIDTQQRCEICGGSGLVLRSRTGMKYTQARKCYACGGFIPFVSWKRFWLANLAVGNGGILRRPAADYEELNEKAKLEKEEQQMKKTTTLNDDDGNSMSSL